MSLFKFRILDYHNEAILNEEGDVILKPILSDGLKTFHMIIDVVDIRISAFRSDVILDEDGNPTEVTKVFLSDGSFVFGANKLDSFEANYRDNYLTLFTKEETPT
jgi:hypothetical protein